ncbi:MAG: TolC family protein [Cyclobacteriaceae bacterium]|jgi:outer membrane protein TolC|nr:TolC family protein [Cyclobacteriaceae bacterium]
MNKKACFLVVAGVLLSVWHDSRAQVRRLTLDDVVAMARAQSPRSKQAETRKENLYWTYRYYKSNYNPQLRLSGNFPNYSQDFTPVTQPDGSIEFRSRQQTNSALTLGLQQPIPWTGGVISMNTSVFVVDDIERDVVNWSGVPMNIRLDQPLFSFNRLRWDRMIEPLRYEESRREYVEEMEFIAREAVSRFFAVMTSQINLQIAEFNLANNDTIYKIEQGRYNIGTTSQDKLLQVELQLLRSRQDVAQAKLDQETNRLRLRSFVGMNDTEQFELVLPEEIPQFEISLEEALERARANRADFIAFERRRLEAESQVASAKGDRFDATLTASYGLNNSGSYLSDIYHDPLRQQRFNIGFNVPVLDWGRNKARLRTAIANKEFTDYVIAQDEVNFEQEILTQVRQFEMLRLQIEITKKSDEVAQERYNVAQNRYLIGRIDITNLNIALTEKDDAKRSYILALQSFWQAYYDLRRLTLYDFATDTPLYVRDDDE